jgi:hypothetical protein
MTTVLKIDTAWHPLVTGCPPTLASEWGEDRDGVFIAFTLGEVTQRLRWIPPGRFLMGSPEEEARGLAKEDWEGATTRGAAVPRPAAGARPATAAATLASAAPEFRARALGRSGRKERSTRARHVPARGADEAGA